MVNGPSARFNFNKSSSPPRAACSDGKSARTLPLPVAPAEPFKRTQSDTTRGLPITRRQVPPGSPTAAIHVPTADICGVGQTTPPSDLENPAIDPSTTVSVVEATRRLGVGRARVYQLIEAGSLDTLGTQPVRITWTA